MIRVLDTNVLSALMRGEATVVARFRRANRAEVLVPQPVLAELAYGIERLPPSKRREGLKRQYDAILEEFPRSTWTDDVTKHFGRIKSSLERRGDPIEDFDLAIAAHALAEEATLVTANLSHMTRVPGLRVEDWSRG